MKIWILTCEYNEYDQYGEYFCEVYKDKPTHQQLTSAGVETKFLRTTLNNTGRTFDTRNRLFRLREVETK